MKGKIDSNGWLRIDRGGKERLQECPFMQRAFEVNDIAIAPCGDWCPLFGEPKTVKLNTLHKADMKEETALVICHGKCLVFDQLTDDRPRLGEEICKSK